MSAHHPRRVTVPPGEALDLVLQQLNHPAHRGIQAEFQDDHLLLNFQGGYDLRLRLSDDQGVHAWQLDAAVREAPARRK